MGVSGVAVGFGVDAESGKLILALALAALVDNDQLLRLAEAADVVEGDGLTAAGDGGAAAAAVGGDGGVVLPAVPPGAYR